MTKNANVDIVHAKIDEINPRKNLLFLDLLFRNPITIIRIKLAIIVEAKLMFSIVKKLFCIIFIQV